MIDEQTERAVKGWFALGELVVTRRAADERATCARCGSSWRVMGREAEALCARCYLEHGER